MADTAPTAPPRWTEYRTVDDLPPAHRNAKDHDQAAMRRSVRSFGFIEPVVLDERTGRLLGGHGRTDYVAELEASGRPDDWPDGVPFPPEGLVVRDDGRWTLPVTRGWASRDDAHADAAALALNRVGELGGWVPDTLADMLDSLRGSDLLDAAGFTTDYLDDLIGTLEAPSLDDLAGKYGDPDPTHLWPVLRFKVAPQDRDRYLRLVEGIEGGDDVLFAHLLTLAERP